MSLCMEPCFCNLPAAGGNVNHKLHNCTGDRIVFKVKSSNNNQYRITPVYGFIPPLSSIELNIARVPGPPKDDKLVVQFAPTPPDALDAQSAFSSFPPVGQFTVPISAKVAVPEVAVAPQQ